MIRREDSRLLQGCDRYLSDIDPAGVVHAVFLRADRPHARILHIDAAAAVRQPGVLAVLTAAELAADGIPDIPIGLTMPGPADAARRVLARDKVRFVGEPVALVVARSAREAVDAVEHIQISYEDLPEVASIDAALQDSAPSVWPEAPDNIGFDWFGGDAARVADAFRGAAHVTRRQIRVSRVVVNALEVRSALGEVDADGRLTLTIGHQQPYALRDVLARAIFLVEPSSIRIRVPDIGGSFGLKTGVHSEEVAVLWAARRLRRPVKWVSTRSEAFLGDDHARDVVIDAALALDGDGMFLGFETRFDVNVGCYLSGRSAAPVNNIGGAAGVYCLPAIAARVRGVLTHTSPTGPYRGAGRPEATYALERIIDIAARELGRDPFALRRQNLIPATAMPFRTALTFTYDCGDFAANMDEAARLADIAGFPARRAEAARRGRLRGLGVANLIEAAAGPYGRPSRDTASLNVMPDGAVVLTSGAVSTGQGHETVFSRLVADRLTIPHDRVLYRSGDTDALPAGRGNGGSGASGVSAAAVTEAAEAMIERGRALAANELEVAATDLVLEDGAFVVAGTDLRRSWAQLAAAAGAADGLAVEAISNRRASRSRTAVMSAKSRSTRKPARRAWPITSQSRISATCWTRCWSMANSMAALCRGSGKPCSRWPATTRQPASW